MIRIVAGAGLSAIALSAGLEKLTLQVTIKRAGGRRWHQLAARLQRSSINEVKLTHCPV
jgi:hypothetical protein